VGQDREKPWVKIVGNDRAKPVSRNLGPAFNVSRRGRPRGGIATKYFKTRGGQWKPGDGLIFDAVLRLRMTGISREVAFARIAASFSAHGQAIREDRIHQIYDLMRGKWIKDRGEDPEKGRVRARRRPPKVATK
jgi:hypothetical protein